MTTRLTHALREWMGENHLTQSAAADALGVTQTTISRWLRGTIPDRDTLRRIAPIIGADAVALGDDTEHIDMTGPSIGTVVLAVDEIRHGMAAATNRIDLLSTREMTVNDRRMLVLAIETLIEHIDETRPALAGIVQRCNKILAD